MSDEVVSYCGTGGWSGPKPGDPDNNLLLSAVATYGGINVSWTYPTLNAHAVSHTIIYRGTTGDFANATVRVQAAGGSFYYDRIPSDEARKYYYWIKVVSVNGTVGAVIGPASATPMASNLEIMQDLTGMIDESALGQALKDKIGEIDNIAAAVALEVSNRVSESVALTEALQYVSNSTDTALSYIDTETTERRTADELLINSYNVMAVGLRDNNAAILDEKNLRISGDNALAQRINLLTASHSGLVATVQDEAITRASADGAISQTIGQLAVTQSNSASAIRNIESAKIGYSVLKNTSTPYDGNNSTIVYPAGTYPSTAFPEYAANRTRIIDKLGVTLWNANPSNAANQLDWLVGLPLATSIKQVGVTGPDGQHATLEQAFTAQKGLNNKYTALYEVNTVVNGVRGGFGIDNDGNKVLAIYDVDTFAVGRTGVTGVKPFIVADGVVRMDSAYITKLDASQIDTRGLTIKDQEGNVIFGAAAGLSASYINGLGSLATADSIDYNSVTGTKPPSNADNTSENTAAGIAGQGTLATKSEVRLGKDVKFPDGTVINSTDLVSKLSKINSNTISTFIDGAAITNAYIGNAEIDTLKIKGNAVTVPAIGVGGAHAGNDTWQTLVTAIINLSQPGTIFAIATANQTYGSGQRISLAYLEIYGPGGNTVAIQAPLGGDAVTTNIATAISHTTASAGIHTVKLWWQGQAGCNISASNLMVIGAMR